ncbi:MAG: hypothetical protein ACJAZ2_002048 [Glaciecola sp.]
MEKNTTSRFLNGKFWGLFALLNGLLFLPFYVLNINESSFFPSVSEAESGNLYSYLKLIFIRENLDVFRLSVDFIIVLFIGALVQRKAGFKYTYIFVGVFYVLFLFSQIYSAIFQSLYGVVPMLYNDWSVLKTGFMIVYQGFSFSFMLYIFGILLVIVVLFFLLKTLLLLLSKVKFNVVSKVLLGWLFLLCLVNVKFGVKLDSRNTMQYQSLFITKNILASKEAQASLKNFSADNLVSQYHYKLDSLVSKPNLYFISIESYGKIWLTHDSLKRKSKESLKRFKDELSKASYSLSSNYSESPVTGGLSWIAYSNFSFGFNFKNQGTYNALLENRKLDEYTDLFKVLGSQGYSNYRLVPLFKSGKIVIPWEKYKSFYRVDEWVKYEDLAYDGELFGFGPAVPDQYALHYTKEMMQKTDTPKTLFFLTVSSHNPFLTPDFETDWKGLNNSERSEIDGANLLVNPTFSNYHKAMEYELKMLSDFIRTNRDTNAIYVLFGDHQPPLLTSASDDFETPMHIISKNKNFVAEFEKHGFVDGATPQTGNGIKHESFLTMFLIAFQNEYGIKKSAIEYLPNGINIR